MSSILSKFGYGSKKKQIGIVLLLLLLVGTAVFFSYQKFFADTDTRMNISGRVFDADSNTALADVKISFLSQNYTDYENIVEPLEFTSDSLGTFNITLPDDNTYDLIRLEKEGYWDVEGTYSFASATSEPKEVPLTITMKPGYGKECVHLQTIMPAWNLISTPLTPADANPESFFTYYSITDNEMGVSQAKKDRLKPSGESQDTYLYRWDNDNQGLKTYDGWNPEDFGPIETGAGYWLEYKGETPTTIVMRGKQNDSFPDGTLNIAKAGWALVGLPTTDRAKIAETAIIVNGEMFSITQAFEKGYILSMYYWNSDLQGMSNFDQFSNQDVFAIPGAGYWIETTQPLSISCELLNAPGIYSYGNITSSSPIIEPAKITETEVYIDPLSYVIFNNGETLPTEYQVMLAKVQLDGSFTIGPLPKGKTLALVADFYESLDQYIVTVPDSSDEYFVTNLSEHLVITPPESNTNNWTNSTLDLVIKDSDDNNITNETVILLALDTGEEPIETIINDGAVQFPELKFGNYMLIVTKGGLGSNISYNFGKNASIRFRPESYNPPVIINSYTLKEELQ